MFADLRFAFRQLAKSPAFTIVALTTLALGIGANTALFSVMDRLLYRPLPVPAPDQLFAIAAASPDNRYDGDFNYPLFRDYQRLNPVFEALSATASASVGLSTGNATDRRNALLVSGNYFSMLHVDAALGRVFGPKEGVEIDDSPVVVISHGLWETSFGADPTVIGRAVRIDAHVYTIVGVAPREFTGTNRGQLPDVYLPITMYGQLTRDRPGGEHPLASRYYTWHQIIGRLKPDVTPDQARTAMQTLTLQIRTTTPTNTPERIALLPAAQGIVDSVGNARRPLHFLLVISGLVLLIACANLANLQLARATARAREFAVRIALGATRTRVLRGLLTESVLLSLLGGALGVLVAVWLTSLIQQFQLPGQPIEFTNELDGRLLGFTLLTAVMTGIIFGLAPAWQASRVQPGLELKTGGGATETRGWRSLFRHSLVVIQVALSLVVLISAGLFARSLKQLQRVDPGFEPSRVLVMSFDSALTNQSAPQAAAFYDQLLERTRALPGIEAASLSVSTPLDGQSPGMSVDRIDDYSPKVGEHPWAGFNFVSPDYFRTLGISIVQGREFAATDNATGALVAIVDETFARKYHPVGNPVGWRIFIPAADSGNKIVPVEVVGISRSTRSRNLAEPPRQMVFLPLAQQSWPQLTLAVKTGLEPSATTAVLRALVHSLDANLPVFQVRTLEQQRAGSLAYPRLIATLLGAFGALTLSLVALGLYGVLAYSVGLRTREIGLRLALGAPLALIFRLVLRQGLMLLGIGLGLGLATAVALTGLLRSQLYAVSPLDPAVFGGVMALFVGVALAACLIPARRASRVDPMVALKAE